MKISQRRWVSAMRMAAVSGLTMLLTGLGRALLKRAANARAKAAERAEKQSAAAREDAEARARMDGEGGSMQPVAVH